MSALFKKLNLNDHKEVVVLDAPASFESELAGLTGVAIKRSLRGTGAGFLLAFVQRRVQVERLARRLGATMEGDATVWFAYPKGSSKRYRCDFNRATGFSAVGRSWLRGREAGGHRRGLVGSAVPAGRVHREDEARPRAGHDSRGQEENLRETNLIGPPSPRHRGKQPLKREEHVTRIRSMAESL